MNRKLTILDIVELVSSKSDITKKEAEAFVKEFFALASEVIASGESLTIKGVGAFEPVWVEARTSVDVNTKQPIEIPGHYKLSFTPDKSMRDAVNAPFAAFTTEVVEVEMPKVEEVKEQETVIENTDGNNVDYSTEDVATLVDTAIVAEEAISETEVSDAVESEKEDILENLIAEKDAVENSVSNVESVKKQESVLPVIDINQEDKIQEEYRRGTRNGYIFGFLTALLIFILLVSAWFFLFKDGKGLSFSFSSFKISALTNQPEQQDANELSVVDVIDSLENNVDTLVVEPIEVENVVSESKDNKPEIKYPIIETIQRGKFLTTISEKYYGDKVFWVYIYRENSGRIWNPRDLKAGFKVTVPNPEKYGIDTSDPKAIQKAKELEKQILYEIE